MIRPVVLCVAVMAFTGCGASEKPPSGPDQANATGEARPAIGRSAARKDEILVRGDASPKTHGPFRFHGRYLVRFEQYAPEDPKLDFASQTPFTASLTPRRGDPRGATKLFADAIGKKRRELTVGGRYYVDVSFGDFPYVIRFTPRSE